MGAKVEDSIISGLVTRQGGMVVGEQFFTATFPVSFPHKVLSINVAQGISTGQGKYTAQVLNYNRQKADCYWGSRWERSGYALWNAIGT